MDGKLRGTELDRISSRPLFKRISSERNGLGAVLAIIMATMYFSFICVVAFSPSTLATPVASGSVISVGVICGVGLMFSGLILTAVYSLYASKRLDPLTAKLREEIR